MSATEVYPGHFLPKTSFGGNSLRQCRNHKWDDVVVIEVDSDDFGAVIILDVPESFHEKFRKKPKHVISIDDDDDDHCENRSKTYNPNGDAPASDRFPPTSVAHSSSSVEHDFVSRENAPVRLSKSKRTYSAQNFSKNRYGLSSGDDCSSENDFSDSEFMGESFGNLNEQLKQAFFTESDDKSHDFPEQKAGDSAPDKPADNRTEECTSEHSEPPGKQSNLSNFSFNRDTDDAFANYTQKQGSNPTERSGHFKRKLDADDIFDTYVPDFPVHKSVKQTPIEVSEPFSSRQSFSQEIEESVFNSAEEIAEQCDSSQLDDNSREMNEVSIVDNYTKSNKSSQLDVKCKCTVSSERDKIAEFENDSCHEAHDNGTKSSSDLDFVITDRQKMKESDEYKRAMEEEWASRQQQLQIQAEEVRRLRGKKRADNMRIKANERRQIERLEEIRETRRKDEENLNLKDQIRFEIKNELHKLEKMCGDMSSLLRCLGIHIGSPYPSQKEIQTAYKRACLKFHPDRYSKSDLRQQVEAEEIFKLISNMKDRLLFK